MGYPTTVDTGLVTPAIISNEAAALASNATQTYAANKVFVYAFEVLTPITITAARWHCGSTAAGTTNMGIYTLAGALVAGSDTGAVANSVSADVTSTYGTAVTLSPGQYLMGLSSSNGTDTYLGHGLSNNSLDYRGRISTNSTSAGALPSTLGTLLVTVSMPACCLLVSGGLG